MSLNAFEQAGTDTCVLVPHTVGDAQNIYIDLQCLGEFETVDMDASPAPGDASPPPGDVGPAQFQGVLAQPSSRAC